MGSYWKLLLVFIVSSLFLFLSCHGTTNNQLFYNFPINSLLTCRVPNQAAGQQASMPEPRFRVPLQPGPTGTVWRPALSQFRLPSGSPDQTTLFNFLGADFNEFFTSVNKPRDLPVLAVGSLTVEGSAGADIIFMDDPTPPPPGLAQLDTDVQRQTVLRWIRDGNLGNCPLTPEWITLDDSYFPRYFSGSRCGEQGLSCSFPAGQTCEPDVGPGRLAYVPVLRWDCCWSYIQGRWNWECGWRKVDAPIIVDCHCGCQPRQRTDFK